MNESPLMLDISILTSPTTPSAHEALTHTHTHTHLPPPRCSGETLLTLITDILDFSRIEANKMVLNHSPFKLETVVEAAMEIAGLRAAQKRLQVGRGVGR